MFTYAKLALILFQLGNSLVKYLHDRDMLKAGEAQALANTLVQATAQVALANKAADAADAKANGDPAKVDQAIFEEGA